MAALLSSTPDAPPRVMLLRFPERDEAQLLWRHQFRRLGGERGGDGQAGDERQSVAVPQDAVVDDRRAVVGNPVGDEQPRAVQIESGIGLLGRGTFPLAWG